MIDITVIIPHRASEGFITTEGSLRLQTYKHFRMVPVSDEGKGANFARNKGFRGIDTEFVMFSDNDIIWKSHALENMRRHLLMTKASFAYGRYKIGEKIWSHQPWNAELLKWGNYISTMALWRTKDFPGFDEQIQRFQDWDVYLTAIEQGKYGVYINDLVFTTEVRPGITHDDSLKSRDNAERWAGIVKAKHNIL